jgi:membrane associated rhomboid family serine protease
VLGRQRVLPRLIARGLRQRLLLVLVINVALSFLPGIDLYAHFGGGLVGFLLAREGRVSRPVASFRPREPDGARGQKPGDADQC